LPSTGKGLKQFLFTWGLKLVIILIGILQGNDKIKKSYASSVAWISYDRDSRDGQLPDYP
jgi:hypothetical protein